MLAWGLAFVLISQASGQDARAKVSGTVSDASGGVVANTALTLTNVNTGIVTKRTSGSDGGFAFDIVEPGSYQLTAESNGFRRFVQENIVVQVRADVSVNVVLQTGALSQQVTVSDTPPALELTTSTQSLTIDRKMLTDLPVLARNPFSLALLDSAVVNTYWTARNPFYMWAATGITVDGTGGRIELLLDGAALMLTNKGSYSPAMDAVQEFAVQSNSVDAEFGFSSGSTMSVATRSGTNAVHGTAYYFGRNPALNAVTNTYTRTPSTVRNNIWGGTVGAPIKKDKLFTFTGWEQWRTKNPRTSAYTLPTDMERGGDFSKSLNAAGGLRQVFDPWSSHWDASSGKYLRNAFAGNVLPASSIDSTATRLMADVWKPTSAGDDITGANNFRETYSDVTKYWNLLNRTDYNITDKWRVFGRYSQYHSTIDEHHTVDSLLIPYGDGGAMQALNVAGNAVYSMNSSTVLDFNGSYTSAHDDYWQPHAIGEKGLNTLWPNGWYAPYTKELSAIYMPAFNIGPNSFGNAGYWFEHPKNLAFSTKILKTMGAHSLKAGLQYRRDYGMDSYPTFATFTSNADMTANTFQSPNTRLYGDPWATFLTGALDSGSNASYAATQRLRTNAYGAFLQDDYRVSRRLTINLGLRYEYSTAPTEAHNRISRYLDLTNPIPQFQANPIAMPAAVTSIATIPYSYNGAWMFATGSNPNLYNSSKISFMPRAGMALQLSPKTVLRAGYSRSVVPPNQITPFQSTSIPLDGYSASTTVTDPLLGVPQATLSNPYPSTNPLILPLGNALGRYQDLGSSATWEAQDMRTASYDRVSVSLQREIVRNLVGTVTYFGNFGRNLPYSRSLNMTDPQLSYTYGAAVDQTVKNPFYGYGTAQTFPGQLRNQPTVAVSSLLRQYPQYGALTQINTPGLADNYNALQVKIQRQLSNNLSFLISYNYNHESGQVFFNSLDQYSNKFTFIPSSNPRHRLNVSGSYELPMGTGRTFLSKAPKLVNAALGGWSASWVFSYNSGSFLRFKQMIVTGDPASGIANGYYFNTSVFKAPLPYTSRTNPYQYDSITGPNFANIDAALSKYFPITDRMKIEFKLEAYNMTNSFMAANPNMSVYSSTFGRSTAQANSGREMQYTMRLHF